MVSVTAKVTSDDDSIGGGLITGETQQGWDVQVGGAYLSIKNNLNLNIAVTDTSANLYFTSASLEYSFNKSTTMSGDGNRVTLIEHCNSTRIYMVCIKINQKTNVSVLQMIQILIMATIIS